jgi:hypothetical protein
LVATMSILHRAAIAALSKARGRTQRGTAQKRSNPQQHAAHMWAMKVAKRILLVTFMQCNLCSWVSHMIHDDLEQA